MNEPNGKIVEFNRYMTLPYVLPKNIFSQNRDHKKMYATIIVNLNKLKCGKLCFTIIVTQIFSEKYRRRKSKYFPCCVLKFCSTFFDYFFLPQRNVFFSAGLKNGLIFAKKP